MAKEKKAKSSGDDEVPLDIKREFFTLVFQRAIDPLLLWLLPNATDNARRIWRLVAVLIIAGGAWAFGKLAIPPIYTAARDQYYYWTLPRAHGDKISFVVADLNGDQSGALTENVEQSLENELGGRVEIIRVGRSLSLGDKGSLDTREAEVLKEGEHLLRLTHADVLLWGRAVESRGFVDLRFLAASSQTLGRSNTYPLDQYLHLPVEFGKDVDASIVAAALFLAAPASDRGRYRSDDLMIVRAKLAKLAPAKPTNFSSAQFARLLHAYGLVCFAIADQTDQQSAFTDARTAFLEEIQNLDVHADAQTWALAQADLGSVLGAQGPRKSDISILSQAEAADRQALLVFTRAAHPDEWALVQINLGDTLRSLGERSTNQVALTESVVALQLALHVVTPRHLPSQWARAKNDLGGAYFRLGEQKGNQQALISSINVYHEALTEWTKDKTPLYWARLQNNIGDSYAVLASLNGSQSAVKSAISSYQDALAVYSRSREPGDWAMVQSNLGAALEILGEKNKDTTLLWKATIALRLALDERDKDRKSLAWANTESNLASTLQTLGTIKRSRKILTEALNTHLAALTVYDTSSDDFDRNESLEDIADTRKLLARKDLAD